jgi:hypothetical protein
VAVGDKPGFAGPGRFRTLAMQGGFGGKRSPRNHRVRASGAGFVDEGEWPYVEQILNQRARLRIQI